MNFTTEIASLTSREENNSQNIMNKVKLDYYSKLTKSDFN